MKYNIDTELDFGKYQGLTIREVYQGSLKINRHLIRDFLNHILNSKDFQEWALFDASNFIEKFDLTDEFIRVNGEIANHELPEGPRNKMLLGNLEKELGNYINQHFRPDFLGVLPDLGQFNNLNIIPLQIGGDPQYFKWCKKNIDGFQLTKDCEDKLSKLSYAKLIGLHIMYIGNETYDYSPNFKIMTPA